MSDPREALLALLRQADHAPMSTHDPRDGSCQSCPWPLHEMPPEDIADAILAAGWTPPTVKPSVEDVAAAIEAETASYDPVTSPERGEPESLLAADGSDMSLSAARAVLALLPGRTEAEVYREGYDQGLRDAASVSRSEAEVRQDERHRLIAALRAKFGVTNRASDYIERLPEGWVDRG